jgi:uncharacterized protein (DUF1778 family)
MAVSVAPNPTASLRKANLSVRIPPGDRALAEHAARLEGLTLSSLVSTLIGPALRRHLSATAPAPLTPTDQEEGS